jgi:hypothetical protein
MSDKKHEAEVSTIGYVGPHSVRPDLYEIDLTLAASAGAPQTRVSLLLRPAEAIFLAHMLQRNPPLIEAEDHLLNDIARFGS